MSQENVEIVREWLATWAGREMVAMTAEPEAMAKLFALIHPEFEGRWASELPDVETYRGVEGAQRMAAEWLEPWQEYRQELTDLIDAGEAVVASYVCRGRGKESGTEVEMEVTHIYTVRDAKVATLHEYMTKAEALKAAGLSE
jgi:ketosteroid isomerase-like protein